MNNNEITSVMYMDPKRCTSCKYKHHLHDKLQALVYYHPNGRDKYSTDGYVASYVRIPECSEQDTRQLKIVWSIKDIEPKKYCGCINNFAKKWAIGFDDLFLRQNITKCSKISVEFTILPSKYDNNNNDNSDNNINSHTNKNNNNNTDNNNNSHTNNINNNNNKRFTKKRQPKLNEYFNPENPRKKPKIAQSNESPMYQYNYYNHKLSTNEIMIGIQQICDQISIQNASTMIPTIDCFATNTRFQSMCNKFIKNLKFFDEEYNDPNYWIDKLAWIDPPCYRESIIKTIKLMKIRKMKAICCLARHEPTNWLYKKETYIRQLMTNINTKAYVNMTPTKICKRIWSKRRQDYLNLDYDIYLFFCDFS